MSQMMILSGCDRLRFPTMINHRAYADRHDYAYRFDISPRLGRANVYFHKLAAIADALPHTTWLFWIDDDAAFTQLDRPFSDVVPEMEDAETFAVFCVSPVNPQGGWTALSSGNFFVRNCVRGRALIEAAQATDLALVEDWWDPAAVGMFTGGDQDALVYQIKTNPLFAAGVQIVEYERFNTRPYHFQWQGQHFLAHFTHLPQTTKIEQMREFKRALGLDDFFLPPAVTSHYDGYAEAHRHLL